MSEEELNEFWRKLWDKYYAPALNQQDQRLERLVVEFEREHEELKTRAIEAETKLKLYEALLGKLNLNVELKND